jgi:sugar (glycoside-pentoside-hexuronide) transporter
MNPQDKRNRYFFGLGTIGRDMFYTLVSMYLLWYLTEILNLPDSTMWWMTGILTVLRIFDAVNDPIMGVIVDNTHTRFGKFKPWIAIGAVVGAFFMVLMFSDLHLSGTAYLLFFVVIYLGWDFFYGANDIAYWSMLPSLSTDQNTREKMGSFARICANIGLAAAVAGTLPVTGILTNTFQNAKTGWFVYALVICLFLFGFQCFTLFGVKEKQGYFKQEEHTTLRDMFKVLFKNDQLLWVAIAMALVNIGYFITTSFGTYFFKYAFKNEGMYSVFAALLVIFQIIALSIFPLFRKKYSRKQLFTAAIIMLMGGYLLFFFSPMNMIPIAVAGALIFVGQAFIQLLMLMFLADTIEYGQWKLGKRNESITFSVQPFINKIGGAISTGVVSATVIISGINSAATPEDVTADGLLIMKLAMMVLPMIVILVGYLIYKAKFKIDGELYRRIISELTARGDLHEEPDKTSV